MKNFVSKSKLSRLQHLREDLFNVIALHDYQMIVDKFASVVVIDDDSDFNSYIKRCFNQLTDYSVKAYTNEFDAIDEISTSHVDLFVIDINLTKVEGTKIASFIRMMNNEIETPIIFVSSDLKTKQKVMNYGMRNTFFLPKPFNVDVLNRTLIKCKIAA